MRDYCIREANQVTCCWAYGPDTTKDAMNYELGRKHVESMRSDCVNWMELKQTARNQATSISCTVYHPLFKRETAECKELYKNVHILHADMCLREKLQKTTRIYQSKQASRYTRCEVHRLREKLQNHYNIDSLHMYEYISCIQTVYFFLVSWGGVRLSPLGTSATNWTIVPAPDDR
jgi:hypothetical protein